MSIGNSLLSLMGVGDPRQKVLQAAMGASAAPGGATPAAGAGAPGTAPAAPPPQPQAYASPQELIDLYGQLMDRQGRASNIDRGIGLIAGAFSEPENRANLLSAATGGSSGSGGGDPMGDILGIYQAQQEQVASQQEKIRRAAIAGGIAKEFNISEDVATLLSDNEQLDDYVMDSIKYRAPNHDVQKLDDGSVIVIDKDTGKKVSDVAGPNGQPTADQKNYEYYRKEAESTGTNPIPFEEFIVLAPKAGATRITNDLGGHDLTPGQEAVDKAFAADYTQWIGAGYVDNIRQTSQLRHAIDLLSKGENITGPIQAGLQALGIDSIVNPNGTIAREAVEEVVQRSLRETLGAQFTQAEGERLIARTFNSALSQEENLRRANLLFNQIEGLAQARQSQVEYFQTHGTLRGYKGKHPSLADLHRMEEQYGEDPTGPAPSGSSASSSAGSNPSVVEGQTARNDKGDRVVFRNGKWEPL